MNVGAGTIVILILVSVLGSFPSAYASAPVRVQTTGAACSICTTQAVVYSTPPTANNVLVVMAFCQNTADTATTTISDTRGNVWTQANTTNGFVQQNGGGTQVTRVNIWTATNAATGADTVTVGCTTAQGVVWGIIYEFSGVTTANIKSERTGTTTGTSFTTNFGATGGSASFSGDTVLVAAIFCSSCLTITPGAGFTALDPFPGGQADTEYSLSGVTSPTNFPATGANSYWVDFGVAIFGQLNVIQVVACTFTQIQCWWYPMVFLGIYSGGFFLIAKAGNLNGKDMTYLLLAGLTFASMIMVQMNMTNIMLPMILSITGIVYAVRGR